MADYKPPASWEPLGPVTVEDIALSAVPETLPLPGAVHIVRSQAIARVRAATPADGLLVIGQHTCSEIMHVMVIPACSPNFPTRGMQEPPRG